MGLFVSDDRIQKFLERTIKLNPCPGQRGMNKMIGLFKNAFWYIIEGTCTVLLHMLKYVPGMQEMCDEVVCRKPHSLELIPDIFKTQEMCDEAIGVDPYALWYVPGHLRMREMFERVVENELWLLKYVPDHLKTENMFDKAFEIDL